MADEEVLAEDPAHRRQIVAKSNTILEAVAALPIFANAAEVGN